MSSRDSNIAVTGTARNAPATPNSAAPSSTEPNATAGCMSTALALIGTICAAAVSAKTPVESHNNFVLRQFSFPEKFSLGKLYAYDLPKEDAVMLDAMNVARGAGRFLAQAKGRFTARLRPLEVVYFLPSYELLDHTEVLKNVDPNCIDCLSFTGSALMVTLEKKLPDFALLTGLRRLEIDASELKDKDLLPLKALKNLQALSLVGNGINGSCFKEFSSMKKLTDLNLDFNPLDKSTFVCLSHFDSLERLKLNQCRLDDEGVRIISRLPHLKHLEIGQSALTTKALTYVSTIKQLKFLNLTGCPFKAADLRALKGMNLKSINLPERRYLAVDMKILKDIFPHTKLGMPGAAQPVDKETQDIFAPLK